MGGGEYALVVPSGIDEIVSLRYGKEEDLGKFLSDRGGRC